MVYQEQSIRAAQPGSLRLARGHRRRRRVATSSAGTSTPSASSPTPPARNELEPTRETQLDLEHRLLHANMDCQVAYKLDPFVPANSSATVSPGRRHS